MLKQKPFEWQYEIFISLFLNAGKPEGVTWTLEMTITSIAIYWRSVQGEVFKLTCL